VSADVEDLYVEDGFGSVWRKCGREECDLHVVRPGKAQCCGVCDDDEILDGSW